MSSESTVKFTINKDGIAIAILSRPQYANAINSLMALELRDIFLTLPPNVRTVILTGEGTKNFSAGADLKERNGMTEESWQTQHKLFRETLQSIVNCPIPVIAAVNGAAYGGGLELALGCDFIYASETAHFAFPEATLGIMPGMGGTQNLPRAIGLRRAKELLLTGKRFSAVDAYNWHIVNKICTAESLTNEVFICAQAIVNSAPLSVKAIKHVTTNNIHLSINEALLAESDHYNRLLATNDRNEGISAFNEKRKPIFIGK